MNYHHFPHDSNMKMSFLCCFFFLARYAKGMRIEFLMNGTGNNDGKHDNIALNLRAFERDRAQKCQKRKWWRKISDIQNMMDYFIVQISGRVWNFILKAIHHFLDCCSDSWKKFKKYKENNERSIAISIFFFGLSLMVVFNVFGTY